MSTDEAPAAIPPFGIIAICLALTALVTAAGYGISRFMDKPDTSPSRFIPETDQLQYMADVRMRHMEDLEEMTRGLRGNRGARERGY